MTAHVADFVAAHSRALLLIVLSFALAGGFFIFRLPIAIFPETNFPRIVILVDNGIAPVDVQMLTGAVQNYSVKYGDYPPSLASLLQPPDGARPYIEQTILIDPWGREYHYQYPGQRNAASGKPDIWSDGPTVADAGGVIGNW